VSTNRKDGYETLFRDWILANRREALFVGAFTLLSGVFNRAYADGEFPIGPPPQTGSKSGAGNVEASQSNGAFTVSRPEETPEPPPDEETGDQLGIAFRAPMCGLQNLTASQFHATGTAAKIPDNLSVPPGSFFSDNPSRRFLSTGETALATALRSTATTLEGLRRPDDLMLPDQPPSTAVAKVSQFIAGVDWSELGRAAVEKTIDTAIDFTKDKIEEKVIISVVGARIATAYITINPWIGPLIGVVTPTMMNRGQKDELTAFDRLSPSEKREFRIQAIEHLQDPLIPKDYQWQKSPDGSTLHKPY
jgi:hypothetical protein